MLQVPYNQVKQRKQEENYKQGSRRALPAALATLAKPKNIVNCRTDTKTPSLQQSTSTRQAYRQHRPTPREVRPLRRGQRRCPPPRKRTAPDAPLPGRASQKPICGSRTRSTRPKPTGCGQGDKRQTVHNGYRNMCHRQLVHLSGRGCTTYRRPENAGSHHIVNPDKAHISF